MKKFQNAFRGIVDGTKHLSILIQFILGLLALVAGCFLKISSMEWIVVILCIGFVITSEMLNTCIEQICDVITLEKREDIRKIKDIAAGAVLMASIASLVVAMIILFRHLGG